MIPLNPNQLPAQNENVIHGSQLTAKFFYLIRALYNRTGGNSGIPFTVGSSLVAAGADQAHALALGNDFNSVTSGSGGVALAQLQPGQFQVVFSGIGSLSVYPFLKGQIDALAVNSPYILSNGKSQLFWCDSLLATGGSFYRSLQLG